jgi:hypothetical protein
MRAEPELCPLSKIEHDSSQFAESLAQPVERNALRARLARAAEAARGSQNAPGGWCEEKFRAFRRYKNQKAVMVASATWRCYLLRRRGIRRTGDRRRP